MEETASVEKACPCEALVGVDGSSSPTGIRILAQGCRPALRSSEARRREQSGGYPGYSRPRYPNPNGVASVPESFPDVFLIPALAMKSQKLPVFVLKCAFAVMFLLVVNILGHNRKLGFGNGEATVTGLP
jgi:hypothetical protein